MADIVDWARTQIGTVEKPAGTNKNPYGAILKRNGEAWCEAFVVVGGIQDGYDARQHCDNVMFTPEYLKDLKAVGFGVDIRKAKPGASVSFHMPGGRAGTNHAGILVAVFFKDGEWWVTTIDGNTGDGGAKEYSGGRVALKTRRLSTVTGCVQPPLASHRGAAAAIARADATLQDLANAIAFSKAIHLGALGDNNLPDVVRILQAGLNRWADRFAFMTGRPNPPDIEVNGRWEAPTWDAVTALQQLVGITPDTGKLGHVDRATWNVIYP